MVIEINEKSFKVGVLSLKRNFEVDEKYRVTTEDGTMHREIKGIYKAYTLVLGNINEEVYDELISVLTSTDEYQTVRLPDGKDGYVSFEAMFEGISDELMYERDGVRHWTNLNIKFTARISGGA